MASNIDPTHPVTGNPRTANVRANFSAAKDEIEALQTDTLQNAANIAQNATDISQVASDLADHESDTTNPHQVTAAQAGADPSGSAAAVQSNLDAHEADTSNPHAVTKSQVGLGNVTDDAQLKIAANLSDVADADTARENLGIGFAFRAHKNGTNQSGVTTGTFVKVTFETEDFDEGGFYDAANSRFLPTVAGLYRLSATVRMDDVADGSFLLTAIYKNGAIFAGGRTYSSSVSADLQSTATTVVEANGSTDFFEVYIFHDHGSDREINGSSQSTWFDGERV